MSSKQVDRHRSGWDVATFANESGVARATLYNLWASNEPQLGPRYVHIRRRRVIIESPREWLHRLASSR